MDVTFVELGSFKTLFPIPNAYSILYVHSFIHLFIYLIIYGMI